MEQKQIDRINELARKAKTPEGLTEWEEMERAALRREYIDSVLGSLRGQLDNTYLVDEKGQKHKLKKKGEIAVASPKKKEDSDWFSWALIVFLFLVELWPIALILLLAKLFGKDRNKELPPEKSPSQARAAAKRMTRSPIPKKSTARWLQIIGALVAVVGVLGALDPLDALFYSSDWIGLWLEDFLAGLAMAVAGIAMLGKGYFMDRQLGALFQVSGSTWRPGRHAGGRTGENPGLSGAPNRAGFTADD